MYFKYFVFSDFDDGENLSNKGCGRWDKQKAAPPWRVAIGIGKQFCFGVILSKYDVLTRKPRS